MSLTNCKYIDDYIDFVRNNPDEHCKEQFQLCDMVERIFETEDIRVNKKQLEKYLSYEKYFPFKLFPWELFCFTLHNCTYDSTGQLRFPVLFCYVGRGTGKNGYLAFEDFCLLTPTNGISNYDIDIFAMAEDQAKTSWQEVYDVLENNEAKMKKHFHWTLEKITNLDTNSVFKYRTSSFKTKDGGRPGAIAFDEYHAYTDYRLVTVATTGLGKKPHPRRTIITTDGDVRGGPLDDMKMRVEKILSGESEDNGLLPFICRIDNEEEVHNKKSWNKANPSLRYLPALRHEMNMEYGDYILNPATNTAFMVKRMNFPPRIPENAVTSWENILATNQEYDESDLYGQPCVAGIDYAKTTDFVSAGLLYEVDGKYIWITHTWICSQCADLSRIVAPLQDWERIGLLTFVDGLEIPPDLPVTWLAMEANKRNSQILQLGIDNYRYTLLSKSINEIIFPDAEKIKDYVTLLRPSDEMKRLPVIVSDFLNKRYVWGDNPLMRWACNNSKTETVGINTIIGKIEPKSRKTDPFKAFVAALCVSDALDNATDWSFMDLMRAHSY